jgi:hypothetical protein
MICSHLIKTGRLVLCGKMRHEQMPRLAQTRSASGRSASPNIVGNGHIPTGKTGASANRANGDDLDACILCMERFVGTALYRNILRE